MNILALDPALKTGWAVYKDGVVSSGAFSVRADKDANEAAKFLNMYRWLAEEFGNTAWDYVYFEQSVKFMTAATTWAMIGYRTVILMWAERRGFILKSLTPPQVKKHVTGNGRAEKKDMIAWARAQGYTPADDNEADALALLHYAMDCCQS